MKACRIILGMSVVLFALVGCFKTGTKHAPVKYPTKTRSGKPYVANQTDLSRIAWWQGLGDPQLNQLLKQALQANNQIKSAAATVLQAHAQLKATQALWIPTLDANFNGFTGGTWNTSLHPSGALAATPLFSNINNLRFRGYYTGFVPGYSVNILSNIYNIRAAKASLISTEAQAQATKLAVISEMAGAYFMLLSQRSQFQVQATLVKDLQTLRRLEGVRYKDGASDMEAIASLDQQIAQEKTELPQIQSIIWQTENSIRLLMSQNPGPIKTHKNLLHYQVQRVMPKNLPSLVLKNRPDIIVALSNVKLACAQIGVAYSAFFPTISLTGLTGHVAVDLVNLLNLSANFWTAQARAAMKLINVNSYQQIKAAKANFSATYYDYLQTLRSAFKDVDDSLSTENQNQLYYQQALKAYHASQVSYHIALNQYKNGSKDYRNVANAKVNSDRAKLDLITAKAQLLDSLVQFYNAVAGGYNADAFSCKSFSQFHCCDPKK